MSRRDTRDDTRDGAPAASTGAASAPSPFAKLAALRETLPAGTAPPAERGEADDDGGARAPGVPLAAAGKIVVRHQRKGHGGKTVTVVSGIARSALEALCGEMKRALGCGARVDGGDVVLQGELVERAVAFLEKKGAKNVVSGTKR